MGKILWVLIITFALANNGLSQQVYITRNGVASFISNAPLELIKAASNDVNGAIDPVSKTFAFTIDNMSFKGFNSNLQQEHFYENYMETQLYPASTFKGKIIEDINLQSGAEQTIRAKGMLDIHGVAQERIIKGTIKVVDDKLQVKADFTVLLEDHQIKVPKVVNQKIAEQIEVSVSAELIRENK